MNDEAIRARYLRFQVKVTQDGHPVRIYPMRSLGLARDIYKSLAHDYESTVLLGSRSSRLDDWEIIEMKEPPKKKAAKIFL